MTKIAINTSQNVKINFDTASVGERMLAFVIDMVIKLAYLIVLWILIFRVMSLDNLFRSLDSWSIAAIIGVITLPFSLYTLVCESLMEGQTFGKKLMQIKVVKIDGYQASFGDYLIRWIFRLVDILSNSGIVGLICIVVSKNNQRLGGMASGTAVISIKSKVNISHTILEEVKEDYLPSFPQVIGLTDNDVRIIKENFQKALQTNDKVILSKLSDKVKETLKLENTVNQFTEKQFIQVILKDYNYYTGGEE